jgi:hypothetical protein
MLLTYPTHSANYLYSIHVDTPLTADPPCARCSGALRHERSAMATDDNNVISITQAVVDAGTIDALGGVDTLVARTGIRSLVMSAVNAEIFRGANVALADNVDIVTTASTTAVQLYGFLGDDQLSGGGGRRPPRWWRW